MMLPFPLVFDHVLLWEIMQVYIDVLLHSTGKHNQLK